MSDLGRKDFTDKASETLKPQSEKSTTEVAGEKISGAYDGAAQALQPNEEKSTTQKLGDKAYTSSSDAPKEGGSMLDSVKDAASNAAQTVSDTLSGASSSAKGSAEDASKST